MYNQLLEFFQKNNSEAESEHVVRDTPTSSVKHNVNVGYSLHGVDNLEKFKEWYKNLHLC
jgi:hypothetical protein